MILKKRTYNMPHMLCDLKNTFLIRKQILFQRPIKQSEFSKFVSIGPFYDRFLKKDIFKTNLRESFTIKFNSIYSELCA